MDMHPSSGGVRTPSRAFAFSFGDFLPTGGVRRLAEVSIDVIDWLSGDVVLPIARWPSGGSILPCARLPTAAIRDDYGVSCRSPLGSCGW